MLLLVLRGGLWLLAIATIFTQVAFLQPLSQTLNIGLSGFSTQAGTWLTGPKIDLGKTRLSLSTVVTAILAAIALGRFWG